MTWIFCATTSSHIMDTSLLIWIFIYLITLFCLDTVVALKRKPLSDEEKLLKHLFSVYNPSARPVINSSRTVNVDLQFSLLQIQDLNVRSQVLTTTGLLMLDWKDERLTWSSNVSDLDELVIDGKAIWKPEFAVINGAEGIYEDFSNFQAVLYPDGRIHWEPGGVFKTMCAIDITYYPFDSQKCDLQFGAWSYYTSKMNLTTNATSIRLDTYETNGEWHFINTSVSRDEFAFACCPDQKFSNLIFSVYIRRRHTFYIMNVILPGIMTSAVLLSIFFCTPSQKVHIGVAALLSFRLFLLNVADTIPRTSDHVPLLGIYLTCTMAITTLAMVATVFVLNLYGMKEKPVPPWAKKVFVIYVAKLLCMCDCLTPPEHENTTLSQDSESGYSSQYGATNSYNTHGKIGPPSSSLPSSSSTTANGRDRNRNNTRYKLIVTHDNKHMLEEETDTDDGGSQMTDLPDTYQSSSDVRAQDTPTSSTQNSPSIIQPDCSRQKLLKSQQKQRRTKTRRSNSSSCEKDYSSDWIHVAAVCDRLFFWLCFMFIVITTLLLFHPLTTSRYFKIPVIEDKDNPNG